MSRTGKGMKLLKNMVSLYPDHIGSSAAEVDHKSVPSKTRILLWSFNSHGPHFFSLSFIIN